jgi:RNA polymerase sigma-70 factor (ECF subfamily)
MEIVQTIQSGSVREQAPRIPRRHVDRFNMILLKCSPTLYRIAFQKLGNAADAEDAVQDALLSAFKNLHQFRGDAQLSTWLGSIVLNCARMQLRRRTNHTFISLDEPGQEGMHNWPERLRDAGPDPEEALRRTQTRSGLERVVEKLPVRLRVAFRLRVFDGLTTSEAASALGVPVGTLKARFFRASRRVAADMRTLRFPNSCMIDTKRGESHPKSRLSRSYATSMSASCLDDS